MSARRRVSTLVCKTQSAAKAKAGVKKEESIKKVFWRLLNGKLHEGNGETLTPKEKRMLKLEVCPHTMLSTLPELQAANHPVPPQDRTLVVPCVEPPVGASCQPCEQWSQMQPWLEQPEEYVSLGTCGEAIGEARALLMDRTRDSNAPYCELHLECGVGECRKLKIKTISFGTFRRNHQPTPDNSRATHASRAVCAFEAVVAKKEKMQKHRCFLEVQCDPFQVIKGGGVIGRLSAGLDMPSLQAKGATWDAVLFVMNERNLRCEECPTKGTCRACGKQIKVQCDAPFNLDLRLHLPKELVGRTPVRAVLRERSVRRKARSVPVFSWQVGAATPDGSCCFVVSADFLRRERLERRQEEERIFYGSRVGRGKKPKANSESKGQRSSRKRKSCDHPIVSPTKRVRPNQSQTSLDPEVKPPPVSFSPSPSVYTCAGSDVSTTAPESLATPTYWDVPQTTSYHWMGYPPLYNLGCLPMPAWHTSLPLPIDNPTPVHKQLSAGDLWPDRRPAECSYPDVAATPPSCSSAIDANPASLRDEEAISVFSEFYRNGSVALDYATWGNM